ncbi:MAG: SpoIIE family protein phosphatase [Nitrospinae bacterium]|nr:SpoIIE family protein phosphatase [Nitrospinota bacterium]
MSSQTAKTLLLVDDNAINLKILQHTLKDTSFIFMTAENGEEALEQVAKQIPDLILLDIMMPVLDGYETLARLKEDKKTAHIPVIFITGLNDSDSKVKGLTAGANDFVSKPFNASELLARVNTQLRLKELLEQTKQQNEAILNDLRSAKKIQNALLPEVFPQSKKVSFAAIYSPCTQVGGDLYDVFRINDHLLGMYICDVCGHGVSAAMITVFMKQAIQTYITQKDTSQGLSPGELLMHINKNFIKGEFHGFHATIFFMVINEETNELKYSSCGHERLYISGSNGGIREIGKNSLAIGWDEDAQFMDCSETLKVDDRITLYTDGIIESMNSQEEQWGKTRLTDYIKKHHDLPLKEYVSTLLEEVENFTGKKEQDDDIAILAVGLR